MICVRSILPALSLAIVLSACGGSDPGAAPDDADAGSLPARADGAIGTTDGHAQAKPDGATRDAGSGHDAGAKTPPDTGNTLDDAASHDGFAVDAGGTDGRLGFAPDAATLASLDPTGKMIPDTDYPIPSGAVFMASNGVDTNPGTLGSPVATLNRAVALAPAGGTIVVRAGIYRDWYNDGAGNYAEVTKSLTFQSYPHEQAWFDGTDVEATASWTSDGSGHWSMPWSTPTFCGGGYYDYMYDAQPTTDDGPCTHYDLANVGYVDPADPAAGDPQMAFIDGVAVHEVTSLSDATGANFYYDWANKRIYVATSPSGHTIELAARPVALLLTGPSSVIRGLGFRRYATNEYSNITSGALRAGGASSTIEYSVFTEMAAQAVYVESQGGLIQLSVLANNGYTAMGSNGHEHSTGIHDGLVIANNIVNGNNIEHFGTKCTLSCGQAGIKIAHMDGFTAEYNIFENNFGGPGFWCDEACTGGVMIYNVATNNNDGIDYEVSDTGLIASNLVYGNKASGIRSCSANTKIYNNTTVNNAAIDIWIYDDQRTVAVPDGSQVGPDTANEDVENNILSGGDETTFKASRSSTTGTNTGPDTFFSGLDYNSYYRSGGPTDSLFNWVDTADPVNFKSLAALTASHGWESHGQDISSGSDPFFVDQAAGNYVVRSTSIAYSSGKPLPSDVASALGLPTGTVVSRGAVWWPGK